MILASFFSFGYHKNSHTHTLIDDDKPPPLFKSFFSSIFYILHSYILNFFFVSYHYAKSGKMETFKPVESIRLNEPDFLFFFILQICKNSFFGCFFCFSKFFFPLSNSIDLCVCVCGMNLHGIFLFCKILVFLFSLSHHMHHLFFL